MKLGIVGSRDFHDYEKVKNFIFSSINIKDIDCIVSGGAKGFDSLAEKFADEYNIKKKIFPAEWEKHGRAAGFIRNRDIVDNSDILIAVQKNKSKGTQNSIDLAKKKKISCLVLEI